MSQGQRVWPQDIFIFSREWAPIPPRLINVLLDRRFLVPASRGAAIIGISCDDVRAR